MKHKGKSFMLLPPLVLTLLLITLVGPVHASAASVASSGHASAPAHLIAPPKFIKGSTTQSTNWSGYAATGGSGAYSSVSASWTEPSVTCSQTAYSSFWVGLDGYNSSTVEQTGTDSDCSGSTPTYYAWYEMYPKFPVNLSNPVKPGDSMSASVTAGSNGSFTLVISDSTQHWSFQVTKKLTSAKRSSAEVIAEAPSSSGGVLPLADFGTVNFSNSRANGQAIGNFNPVEIVMVTSTGTVKAQPSALSGGTAFSVAWKHS